MWIRRPALDIFAYRVWLFLHHRARPRPPLLHEPGISTGNASCPSTGVLVQLLCEDALLLLLPLLLLIDEKMDEI